MTSYTYFLILPESGLPVAEEAGVKLALRPDDPPLDKMNGVAKIFTHYEGYRRAEQRGQQPQLGFDVLRGHLVGGRRPHGQERGKIFEVHFRNVGAPLPHFVETFPRRRLHDMWRVMKTLREVGFSGAAEADHVPQSPAYAPCCGAPTTRPDNV